MSQDLRAPLEAGLRALGLDLVPAQVDALMEFQGLLGKWNKVYNLTAVRDPQEMLTHHLLDSLAAVPALQRHLGQMPAREGRTAMLDVGSGGGLPGVVFAICCPQIQQAAATLRLPNLRGIHSRVEQLTTRYPLISCRAFASLVDFTSWSRQALEEGGTWLAMKGRHPDDEIAALPAEVRVFHVEPLKVPGLDAERCILWLRIAA
jgi:16S rRNA (guanine527-N7)-methyltransferase